MSDVAAFETQKYFPYSSLLSITDDLHMQIQSVSLKICDKLFW